MGDGVGSVCGLVLVRMIVLFSIAEAVKQGVTQHWSTVRLEAPNCVASNLLSHVWVWAEPLTPDPRFLMPVHQYGYARAAPAADRSRASSAQQEPVRRVRFIGTTPAVSSFRDFAEPSGPGILKKWWNCWHECLRHACAGF